MNPYEKSPLTVSRGAAEPLRPPELVLQGTYEAQELDVALAG